MSLKLNTKSNSSSGFTLLEILLVVGIIAILAGIVILAINPTKQLGDTRNAQRRSDVLTILNALYQFSIDNNGRIATTTGGSITSGTTLDECISSGTDAYELEDSLVGDDAKYLVGIPMDPTDSVADTSSGYNVIHNTTTHRITVCAPGSIGEGNITATTSMIYVTR